MKNSSTNLTRYEPIDEIEDDSFESGDIDRSNLNYTINISLYLQDLISCDANCITSEDDLWIMPTISVYNSYTSATYYYADYRYYTLSQLNGTAEARHPVLKLTYAILK